jgi:hypothetical protein
VSFWIFRGWAYERTRTDVVPSLVDKALGSVRAGTKKKGVELCCMYVEVENGGEGVVVSCPLSDLGKLTTSLRY